MTDSPITRIHSSRADRERGGITIIVVLIILVVMTVAATSVASGAIRDLAISGNEGTGRKAAEAADAGLDWVISYGNPDAGSIIQVAPDPLNPGGTITSVVDANLTGAPAALQVQMGKLLEATGSSDPGARTAVADPMPSDGAASDPVADYGTVSSTSGSLRVFLRSIDYPNSALWLSGKGTTGFSQDTVVSQSFDTEIRYLGVSFKDRLKPTGVKKNGGLFLVRSWGKATVGSTGQSFMQRREALMDYTPH